MESFKLSTDEKLELMAAHTKERNRKLADRIKAILLLDKGYSPIQVAKILLLDESSIYHYKSLYQEGLDKLVQFKYKGRMPKLSPEQEELLISHLDDHFYSNTKGINQFIENHFGISFTKDGLISLLHRLGYVYKQSKLVPPDPDPEKQKEFLKKYEQIKENLQENEKYYFMDAVHPTHSPIASRGWVKKGKEKEIKSNTGRQRININGIYSPIDHEVIVREDAKIDSQSTIELFKQIEELHPSLSKIFIFSDNAKYYYSQAIKTYLKDSRIELIPLPAYSPNLNLIERLWRLLKKEVLYSKYYEKFSGFKNAIFNFFENINEKKEELDTLMTEKFQLFGT